MNTKAMEAAEEIVNFSYKDFSATKQIRANKVATIILKHFPEPSVPVSELETLRKQRDAALKLADEMLGYPENNLFSYSHGYKTACSVYGGLLRAIYADKKQA